MKIVDWQCNFTEHQVHTWRALGDLLDESIVHVVAMVQSDVRAKQGWSSIDLAGLEVIHFKQKNWLKQGLSILRQYPAAIHVFGGFWADKRFLPLYIYAAFRGIKISIMNESYSTEAVGYLTNEALIVSRLKVMLRPVLYRSIAVLLQILSRSNHTSILALSARAAEQFIQAGFAKEQVFPFGYFVPRLTGVAQNKRGSYTGTKLIFVGSLLKRKGIDVAVAAVEGLQKSGVKVQLDIYGHGNPDEYVANDSCCIFYKGTIPFGQTQAVVAQYDALLLPSRHDGWGVVVNEALLQGVPVIVSDHVGAMCLVEGSGGGIIFPSGNVRALGEAISQFAQDDALRQLLVRKVAEIGDHLLPENAARYMMTVFDYFFFNRGARPEVVWCGQ